MTLLAQMQESFIEEAESEQLAVNRRRAMVKAWLAADFTPEFLKILAAYRDANEPKSNDSKAVMQYQIGFRDAMRAIEREIESLQRFARDE